MSENITLDLPKKNSFPQKFSVYGKGKNAYFAFHGFGRSKKMFEPLGDLIPDSQIYGFPLFGHKEPRNAHNDISFEYPNKQKWLVWMEDFLVQNQISKFSIIAHSLGARHAWALIESFPSKIEKVILLAPDGLINHNLFSFCTRNKIGRKVFRIFLQNYNSLNPTIDLLRKIPKLRKLIIFAQSQISSEQKRLQLLETWTAYGDFIANRNLIVKNLNRFEVRLEIYLASEDKVISNKSLESLTNEVKFTEVKYFEGLHHQLFKKWLGAISAKK